MAIFNSYVKLPEGTPLIHVYRCLYFANLKPWPVRYAIVRNKCVFFTERKHGGFFTSHQNPMISHLQAPKFVGSPVQSPFFGTSPYHVRRASSVVLRTCLGCEGLTLYHVDLGRFSSGQWTKESVVVLRKQSSLGFFRRCVSFQHLSVSFNIFQHLSTSKPERLELA